ncbi:MAG: protein kinase [Acidobacteria bacterium]|nr:protein kinase [Acidobacteriota bacterium]
MIGQTIGNYRIEAQIGRGGMGVVYKAIDVGLERPVAIKMLPSELASDPQLIERFRAEARAQATLNHPNIASLYAFFQQGDNYFMVMEFVSGKTIADMIRQTGPIPYQKAIPLFKQALLGIGVAHRRGIVHRDIKPNNLMVMDEGMVKVMDFGIARAAGGRRLTGTGVLVGTLPYMSPEQVMSREPDIRSDIYALGATLYEMVTGRLPFESQSDFHLMKDIVETPPPPPRNFYPYIPDALQAAILRALEKDPNARFQSVEEFGAGLEVAERESVTVMPSAYPTPVPAPTPPPLSTPVPGPTVTPIPTPTPVPEPTLVQPVTPTPVPAAKIPVWQQLTQNPKWLIAGGAAVLLIVAIAGGIALWWPEPTPGPTTVAGGSQGGGGSASSSIPGEPTELMKPATQTTPNLPAADEEEKPNVPITSPSGGTGAQQPPPVPQQMPPARRPGSPPAVFPSSDQPAASANRAPIVSLHVRGSAEVERGEPVRLYAQASDPDGDQPQYVWHSSAGRIDDNGPVATLDTSSVRPGPVTVTVTVDDGHGHAVEKSETITVAGKPAASNVLSYSVAHDHVGAAGSFLGTAPFSNACFGRLMIFPDRVVFQSDGGHSFDLQLNKQDIKEVRMNGGSMPAGTFHIKPRSGGNYNLALVTRGGQTINGFEVVSIINQRMR